MDPGLGKLARIERLDIPGLFGILQGMPKYPKVHTSALDVAAFILELAHRDREPVDPRKLQKALYYAQCWSLADGERLFDEDVEAWIHGPVVQIVWKAHAGSMPIQPDEFSYNLSAEQVDLTSSAWEAIRHLSGQELADKTHETGRAWKQARKGLPNTARSSRPISLNDMATEVLDDFKTNAKWLSDNWDDVVKCCE